MIDDDQEDSFLTKSTILKKNLCQILIFETYLSKPEYTTVEEDELTYENLNDP